MKTRINSFLKISCGCLYSWLLVFLTLFWATPVWANGCGLPEQTVEILPRGAAVIITLKTPLNTQENQLHDPVQAVLSHDVYQPVTQGGQKILLKNTQLLGIIDRLEPPFEGRNAILRVVFNTLVFPNGAQLPVRAHVKTDGADAAWGGQPTAGTKPKKVRFNVLGIGSYNKVMLGGPRALGQHVAFPAGEHWTVIFDEPVCVQRH